jgi:chaperone required for assembly of F1-ATPase
MKRFYKRAEVTAAEGGFAVVLDGRPVRTPRKAQLTVRNRALTQAIAAEWDAQGTEILPHTMPMLRLANTAIDIVGPNRDDVVANLTGFGRSDLVCYRAAQPDDLVLRQSKAWDPLLKWLAEATGAVLQVTTGVGYVTQDEAAIARLQQQLSQYDDPELAALNDLITISGSLVIGLAAAQGLLDAEMSWSVARIDEDFQAERWGLDHEAAERAKSLRRDFADALRFLGLHRSAA